MYQDFFLFLVFCFLKFFSVNSLKKKRTHQENKMEVGFLNWFELDMSNHPPWQAVPLPSQAWLLPSGPPALSQPSWALPTRMAFFKRTPTPASRPGPERALISIPDTLPEHIGASCLLRTAPARLLSFVGLTLLSSPRAFLVWNLVAWRARLEWGGRGRDFCPDWKHWVATTPGTGPIALPWGPGALGPPGNCWAGPADLPCGSG